MSLSGLSPTPPSGSSQAPQAPHSPPSQVPSRPSQVLLSQLRLRRFSGPLRSLSRPHQSSLKLPSSQIRSSQVFLKPPSGSSQLFSGPPQAPSGPQWITESEGGWDLLCRDQHFSSGNANTKRSPWGSGFSAVGTRPAAAQCLCPDQVQLPNL